MIPSALDELKRYRARVAYALQIDRICRILNLSSAVSRSIAKLAVQRTPWVGTKRHDLRYHILKPLNRSPCETAPFRELDAPNLRDDYYCSVLAYSATSRILAVGLGNVIYAWSEGLGARIVNGTPMDGVWLTSIAFSSTTGNMDILAAGRSDGSLILTSLRDFLPRFQVQHPDSVTCLSWRPYCVVRNSCSPYKSGLSVQTEELVIGDEAGSLYYYVVEWPTSEEILRCGWVGSLCLVAKISLHSHQVCGLAWSPDGQVLASGGNDNMCFLVDAAVILGEFGIANTSQGLEPLGSTRLATNSCTSRRSGAKPEGRAIQPDMSRIRHHGPGCEMQAWAHRAAVKAIAFCPWREGLVATGGGSNDKCIHFFHTSSGSALATIAVAAQVTSLIWSMTRREIAATFGYAQPEHCFRVAVFGWPECNQIAAIPWAGDLRALYAIPLPRNLDVFNEGILGQSDGCIVVASSDETLKFHELWPLGQTATMAMSGMLGGSDILDDLDGIMKDGDVIR